MGKNEELVPMIFSVMALNLKLESVCVREREIKAAWEEKNIFTFPNYLGRSGFIATRK